MQHQNTTIHIDNQNICRHGNEICANNGRYICYQCSVFSGNSNVPIKFTPALTIPKPPQTDQKAPISEFNAKELVRPPLMESKVLIEDDADVPNILRHVSIAVIHNHSGNWRPHTHYKIDDIFSGNICRICGINVVGVTICEGCQELFG